MFVPQDPQQNLRVTYSSLYQAVYEYLMLILWENRKIAEGLWVRKALPNWEVF